MNKRRKGDGGGEGRRTVSMSGWRKTEEEMEGGQRRGAVERGVNERKEEALAAGMSDLKSELRQPIIAALCRNWGKCKGFSQEVE